MKNNYLGYGLTILGFFFMLNSYAYILNNDFTILNASKHTFNINYNECIKKRINGKTTTTYNDVFLILEPGASEQFIVNANDNNFEANGNFLERTIYIYQVTSENSLGIFLQSEEESYSYYNAHGHDPIQGYVLSCQASRKSSVILDDFGTDKIYCGSNNY